MNARIVGDTLHGRTVRGTANVQSMGTLTIPAAASTAVLADLAGAPQRARWLGAGASALYLLTESSTALAILTRDAVRLPCAVVLPRSTMEFPLTSIAPTRPNNVDGVWVGERRLTWGGPAGEVAVECIRPWTPPRLPTGTPDPAALARLRTSLVGVDVGLEAHRINALMGGADALSAVALLLGRGPGLTPSGDDVLAGLLIGARAFGRPEPVLEQAVRATATDATTALSAQLLRHAARGECVPQLVAVVRGLLDGSLTRDDIIRVFAVGHTSGAALCHGLLAAAVDGRSGQQPPDPLSADDPSQLPARLEL